MGRARQDRLRIPKWSPGKTYRIVPQEDRLDLVAEELLGLLLCQAMGDRMTGLALGIDSTTADLRLTYTNRTPGADSGGEWVMTPPPAEMYPYLLQAALRYTSLGPRLPLSGLLRALKDEEPLDLAFRAGSVESFEITWPPS